MPWIVWSYTLRYWYSCTDVAFFVFQEYSLEAMIQTNETMSLILNTFT